MKNSVFFKGSGLFASLGLLLVFLGSVGLDQVSKDHMHETMLTWENPEDDDYYLGKKQTLLKLGEEAKGPYFAFGWQYSRNKGAAFSMFANLDDKYRVPMFHLITLLAVIMITIYLRTTPLEHILTRFGLICVLSGAVGNFTDRILRGYVVDFIDVEWTLWGWNHDFAIFNVADVAINIGVIALVLDMIIQSRREKHLAKQAKS